MSAHPITALLRQLYRYRGGHVALADGVRRYGLGYNPDRGIAKSSLTDAREYFATSAVQDVSLQQFRGPQLDQNQCGSCFPAGTPILMADGSERPIEEVAEGNEVLTHNGRKRKVVRTMRRMYAGPLHTLRVKGYGYPLTMTAEHPVLTASNCSRFAAHGKFEPNGELVETKAEDLKPFDVVLMPARTMPEETSAQPLTIRVRDYLEEVVCESEGLVRVASGYRTSVIPAAIQLDAKFARLLGLFLAEGSYRKGAGLRCGLTFTFARHEREYQDFVVTVLQEIFGVAANRIEQQARPSVTDIQINNATLARFFYGLCGEYALHKRVPAVLFESSRPVRLAAIRGWLEGDGDHTIIHRGKRSVQMHGATSSIEMHRGFFRLAMSCGLKPGATTRPHNDRQNADPRILSFYSADIFEIFPDKREEVIAAGLPVDGAKKYWRHDFGFLCRVHSIEVEQPEAPIEVFNLEVEGEHTYVANGIAVHNCTGHGTAQAVYTSHAASGKPLGFFPSPRITYGIVRELELDDAAQTLTDSGAMPIDLVTVMNRWGVAPIGTGCTPAMPPTPDGSYSDCYPGNVNDKPSLLDLETSLQKLQVKPLLVDVASPDFGGMIATMLDNKTACGLGLFVDTHFMNYNGAAPIDNIDTSDPNGGGHWLELDYTYMSNGVQIIGGDNSWGTWGKQGSWELTLPCAVRVSDSCLAYKV